VENKEETKIQEKKEESEIRKIQPLKVTAVWGIILLVLIITIPSVYHLFPKKETCEHVEIVTEITGSRAICVDEIIN
jgi:hypothetical protein